MQQPMFPAKVRNSQLIQQVTWRSHENKNAYRFSTDEGTIMGMIGKEGITTTTTVLQPFVWTIWWASTIRDIQPLTTIPIINGPVSASSIYYNTYHHLFAQPLKEMRTILQFVNSIVIWNWGRSKLLLSGVRENMSNYFVNKTSKAVSEWIAWVETVL